VDRRDSYAFHFVINGFRRSVIRFEDLDEVKKMGEKEKSFGIVALCGIIGIIFALILQLMNDHSILINEFLTGTITLRVVQVVVILIWQMVGVIIVALR